jgi:hypothetical protein
MIPDNNDPIDLSLLSNTAIELDIMAIFNYPCLQVPRSVAIMILRKKGTANAG